MLDVEQALEDPVVEARLPELVAVENRLNSLPALLEKGAQRVVGARVVEGAAPVQDRRRTVDAEAALAGSHRETEGPPKIIEAVRPAAVDRRLEPTARDELALADELFGARYGLSGGEARALRVWAGVRPLFQDQKAGEVGATRDVTRSHALLDHRERDGIDRFLTLTGGKLTTFRLMAEEAVTAMCRQLGTDRPCRTRDERLPGSESGEYYHLGARLRARERSLQEQQVICECEFIERDRLEETMRRRGTANLDDIRRSLRLGMGPCQGGFCIYRATGILHGVGRLDGREASASLHSFLQERWKGMWPILYGDQLRQARLDDWIFQGLLDVEHLPPDGAPAPQTADEQPALA